MSRLVRRLAAVLAIAALGFTQLAVSAYSCSMQASAMEQAAAPDSGCEGMATTNLCARHCEYGSSTVQNASLDLVPQVVALALPWRIEADVAPSRFRLAYRHQIHELHSPPPLVLFGSLRI